MILNNFEESYSNKWIYTWNYYRFGNSKLGNESVIANTNELATHSEKEISYTAIQMVGLWIYVIVPILPSLFKYFGIEFPNMYLVLNILQICTDLY